MPLKIFGAGLLTAIAFILWAVASPTSTPPELFSQSENVQHATVTHVIDGDTIVLSTGEKVRYIGIDTPEIRVNGETHECYALEAKSRNEQLVLHKQVRLVTDTSETDDYNRLLRYVYLDDPLSSIYENTTINEILVAEGYAVARSYPPDTTYQALFQEAERKASASKYGIWSNTCN